MILESGLLMAFAGGTLYHTLVSSNDAVRRWTYRPVLAGQYGGDGG
jgi:hypothetical protein